MQLKHRVLIAAQPAAAVVLKEMLDEVVDSISVHSASAGIAVLDAEPGRIALIISTVAFDDSRMLDFLQVVKRNEKTSGIPFVCCRVLSSVLSGDSLGR